MKPLIPDFPVVKFPITDDFAIHGFGILVAIGFMTGARMAMNKARRDGLDPEVINRVVGWLVAGVFIGGHLGHLFFYYPEKFLEDPMSIFRVWEGLSSFGGFIGCTILGVGFLRSERARVKRENKAALREGRPPVPPIDVMGFVDSLMYGFTLGWFFGRMGCFVAHDHPGTPTSSWLGVYGMCEGEGGQRIHAAASACDSVGGCLQRAQELWASPVTPALGQACHDLGLYEGLWSLALIPLFWWLDQKPRQPGFFVGLWLVLYGPFRLGLDAFRTADTRYFGVTPAQLGAFLFIFLGIYLLRWGRGRQPIRVALAAAAVAPAPPEAPPAPAAEPARPQAEDAPTVMFKPPKD